MRKIKFRAWLKNENRYINVNRIDFADGTLKDSIFGNEFYDFNDLVLEQFTGLHDRNGVKIYEGDVVYGTIKGLFGQGYQNGIVKYGEYGFVIDLKKQSWEPGIGMVGFCSFEDYEVIGNIHEESENNE